MLLGFRVELDDDFGSPLRPIRDLDFGDAAVPFLDLVRGKVEGIGEPRVGKAVAEREKNVFPGSQVITIPDEDAFLI